MKRAFRDAYNRELAILKERSVEFAEDYPGLAERLGGLIEDNMDPSIAGLLEGSAFLAARVQLKMQEEYRTFTGELLDQVFPDALAPTPSVMLVRATLPVENAELVKGVTFARGEYLDARYADADKKVTCRYALAAPLTLWPLALTKAVYHGRTGPIGALGQEITPGTKAGLELEFARIGLDGKTGKGGAISEVEIDSLPIYLTGPMDDAIRLYEQFLSDVTRVSLRYLDQNGDAVFRRLPPDAIQQIGMGPADRLFPHNDRLFNGFAMLREAFIFPRKFLGIRIEGLRTALQAIKANDVRIIVEFDTISPTLESRLEPSHLSLHSAPAVNLFEENSSMVRIDRKRHEFVVPPNSSPVSHYEIHHILEVYAHYSGNVDKVKVHPLYALPPDGQDPRQVLYYTARRKPRRLTMKERRYGTSRHRYRGTETYISIYEPPEDQNAHRLQIKALCSNRHLPGYLPIAQGQDDFYFSEDQTVTLSCVAGPSPPRESLADMEAEAPHRTTSGDSYWRLMSYLALNHFGLENRDGTEGAAAMRELLSLFADLSDNITETQIQGLVDVSTRPITRTIRRPDGFHPARGLEVTLMFDEDEFEGSGIMLLAAVLDRFLAEYAAINSFTQCVIHSRQRGHIKTWPPRIGSGPIL